MTVTSAPVTGNSPRDAVPIARQRPRFLRWLAATGWRHAIGLLTATVTLLPLLYVVSSSLNASGTLTGSNELFSSITLDNYRTLVTDPGRPFPRWLLNTVVVGTVTSVCAVLLCALAAYAFSRMRFMGRRVGLIGLVLTQMFPQFLGVVAIFLLLNALGDAVPALGLDSLPGLVMVYLGGALGVNTYLMYGYFNTIPREIDEAALIDGAGHFRIFATIVLPLVRPILVVVAMLTYIAVAGEFVIASVTLSNPEVQTASVGLYNMVNLFRSQTWGAFCAGAVLTALPMMVLFLYAQRFIVSGLFAGSGK